MYVHDQHRPAPTPLPGIEHATWAGSPIGLEHLSLWRQSVAPGAATPPHSHDCEELVLCSAGRGELHIDGEVHPFGADQTLAIPRGKLHQIFNTGPMPLETIGIFAATPVNVFLPDGSKLPLPWQS
jgi:mannose-6-phosphate isomerase-like protein (cupin superfamily)